MSVYGKNHYNIVISLQLIKNKWGEKKTKKNPTKNVMIPSVSSILGNTTIAEYFRWVVLFIYFFAAVRTDRLALPP